MNTDPFLYCSIAAAVLLCAAWQPWRSRHHSNRGGQLGNAFGMVIGTGLAYWAMKGRLPAFPPTEAEHYWVFASLLVLLPALTERSSWLLSSVFGTLLFGAFVWLASSPLREHYWEGNTGWFHVGGAALAGALTFLLRPAPAQPWASGPAYPGALAVASGCAAGLLGLSYGGGAHLVGGIAFFPAVVAVLAMLRPNRSYWPGLASSWIVAVPGLLLVGTWFSETPWPAALAVALSPQFARLPLGGHDAPRRRAVLVALGVAAVGALAIWLSYEPSTSEYTY